MVVLFLPRPQNRARKCLHNLRTFKPRRVNILSISPRHPGLSTRFLSHDLSYPLKFNCSLFQLLPTMDNNARTVRSYRKNSAIQVPATPDYISSFLSHSTPSSTSPTVNSLIASSPDGLSASSSVNSLAASASPFNALGSSSQPRLIQPRQNQLGTSRNVRKKGTIQVTRMRAVVVQTVASIRMVLKTKICSILKTLLVNNILLLP